MQKFTRRDYLKAMLFASSATLLAACSSSATKTAPVQQNAAPTTAPTEAQVAAAAEMQPTATTAAETTASAGETPAAAAALDQNAAALELLSLSLGAIKLISTGTGAAITKDQAAVLIPLWQEYQTLTESMRPADPGQTPDPAQAAATPAAPVENTELLVKLNDLVVRIQAAMTAEQLQAIKDMNITQETMQALIQELGIELGGQGGGPGGGGGQPPQGDGQQPQGTPPAGDANGYPAEGDGARAGGGVMIPTGLVEKLIEALQAIQ